MDIVKATFGDKPGILSIAKQHRDTKAFGVPWYSDRTAFSRGDVWMAVDEKCQVLGFYSARFNKKFDHVTLMFIAVRQDHLRRGIGRDLVVHLQNRIILNLEQTHHKIRAKIERDNPAALAFFQKLGFKGVGIDGNSVYAEWKRP